MCPPIYEYEPDSGKCLKCQGRFSDLQKLSDKPHVRCPECGKACHRVVSSFALGVSSSNSTTAQSPSNANASSETQAKNSKHNHNCAAHGCGGKAAGLLKKYKSKI